jgi:hypothetical protein
MPSTSKLESRRIINDMPTVISKAQIVWWLKVELDLILSEEEYACHSRQTLAPFQDILPLH